MIRRLRFKFVCINMSIVTLMLFAIFAMVFYFTRANLERESMGMMQAVAQDPLRLGACPISCWSWTATGTSSLPPAATLT